MQILFGLVYKENLVSAKPYKPISLSIVIVIYIKVLFT